jgi:excinuclease ABC subunit B
LRLGIYDVLIGVNLLREGLDLPEVALVAILDADKEGFLRSERSLVQTIGRAARNSEGKVIMYADKMTVSMQKTIDETNRRRTIQMEYNTAHNIIPTTILKSREDIFEQTSLADSRKPSAEPKVYSEPDYASMAADPVMQYMSIPQLEKTYEETKKAMLRAAKDLDFMEAARLRDEMIATEALINQKKSK